MKITKIQLSRLIKEELSNTMSEAEQWKMGRSMKAADLAAERGIADAQEDFARIQAGGKVLQIDTTEETQEEEDAYNKGWQNEMDRLKQAAADRKLNRPPEPETPEDIEAAQAEYDFESHFSEGKIKITKSKLAQIIKEELAAVDIEEGMFDAIKNKLSPKRPEAAKAPRERSEHEKKAAPQQGGADAYDFNRGMLEKPNRPNDEDYIAGWNPALQEGTNRMKITKSKLAQIIKEEIDAMKAEGYKAYKRDDDDKKPKRGLGESLALYSGLEDYVLRTLTSLGGAQPVSDIALVAGEAWAADNWSDDDLIDKDDMFYSAKEALQNLQAAGKVRLTQGGPDSSDEDFYAIA